MTKEPVLREGQPTLERLKGAIESFRSEREGLYEHVRQSQSFRDENIMLFNFDTLCNAPVLYRLFSGKYEKLLDEIPNKTLIDIGCANGDFGFAFADIGYKVTFLDKSHIGSFEKSNPVRQNAPLVVSLIAEKRGNSVGVLDYSIDGNVDISPIKESLQKTAPAEAPKRFGLGLAFGLLYHLKNPYGFVENMTKVCDYLVIGTWVFTHLRMRLLSMANTQVAYMLRDCELAADPTNYWVFTPKSFATLVERSGWEILNRVDIKNSARSLPHKANAQTFFLLKNKRNAEH